MPSSNTIISNTDSTQYHHEINHLSSSTSINTIKTLYKLADLSLMAIAKKVDVSEETQKLENQLLEDKDTLILLAAKIKSQDLQNLKQKIDFLNIVSLEEKPVSDYTPTDLLSKSIWENSQTLS